MTVAASPRRSGRHRSEDCDERILVAALAELTEVGYAALTVRAVIDRAGVSSATLYRRFATKQDLVTAALASLIPEPVATDTGSLVGDLEAFLEQIAHSVNARQPALEVLATEVRSNPELDQALRDRFLSPRLIELRDILDRAHRRGDLTKTPPAEQALSLVVGPLYHRAFVLQEPLPPTFVRACLRYARAGLLAE